MRAELQKLPRWQGESASDQWGIPAMVTMLIYTGLSAWLVTTDPPVRPQLNRRVVEFDVPEPRVRAPEPEPEVPPEPPEPEPEPEVPEPEPPKKVRIAKVTKDRTPPPPASDLPPPPPSDEPPAPGENTNDDLPAPKRVYRLPDMGAGGSVPVATGKTTGRAGGVEGGKGTNTGGGGETTSKGTGVKKPVSISAVKRMPKPIGGQDYANIKYPDEARRLGIEGKIKVRLVIDDTGKVIKSSLVTKLTPSLDKHALRLAKRLKFEPALDQDDKAVTTAIVWTFTFTIPD